MQLLVHPRPFLSSERVSPPSFLRRTSSVCRIKFNFLCGIIICAHPTQWARSFGIVPQKERHQSLWRFSNVSLKSFRIIPSSSFLPLIITIPFTIGAKFSYKYIVFEDDRWCDFCFVCLFDTDISFKEARVGFPFTYIKSHTAQENFSLNFSLAILSPKKRTNLCNISYWVEFKNRLQLWVVASELPAVSKHAGCRHTCIIGRKEPCNYWYKKVSIIWIIAMMLLLKYNADQNNKLEENTVS